MFNKEGLWSVKRELGSITLSKRKNEQKKKEDDCFGIKTNKFLYLMILPGILYFIVFRYLPMGGLVIAFQDYQPYLGILGSPWVGFKTLFVYLLSQHFFMLLRNTLILFGLNIFVFFPMPIILSLLLNEVTKPSDSRIVSKQSFTFHFMSWVIIVSITYVFKCGRWSHQ